MELAKTAIYFKNRSPTKSLLNTTSWKSLHKKKLISLIFQLLDYSSIVIISN
jgi:hypothetical protein